MLAPPATRCLFGERGVGEEKLHSLAPASLLLPLSTPVLWVPVLSVPVLAVAVLAVAVLATTAAAAWLGSCCEPNVAIASLSSSLVCASSTSGVAGPEVGSTCRSYSA